MNTFFYRQATVRRPLMAVKTMTAQGQLVCFGPDRAFKHKYTDEETEETVFSGQCDIQEVSNTVQVLTLATVTKFVHYQRHKGWCDTELAANTQTKAEKTATVDSQLYNIKELVDKLTEQVNDETTQKDWCPTELSRNEESRPTLADDASNFKNLENPTMHFAVLSRVKGSIRMVALTQVEEEKDHAIERNIIELYETSLLFNVKEFNVKDFNVRTDEKQNDLQSHTFNLKERNIMIV